MATYVKYLRIEWSTITAYTTGKCYLLNCCSSNTNCPIEINGNTHGLNSIPCGETCLLGFKSSTWHGCLHFPRFIPRFNDAILSVVCDVSVGSEAHVVTSSISRFASPTQFFGGAHRGRVCMRAFIGLSVRLCLWASAPVTGSRKKRNCKSLTSDLLNNTMDWVGNR